MMQLTRVAISLGSNKGDRLAYLKAAYAMLAEDLLQDPIASNVYETPPWGGVATTPFLNAVVVGNTDWKPPAIVTFLKEAEKELGRTPAPRYSDREIDMDLTAYGSQKWNSDGVLLPHPGLTERDFVLLPLQEVWPDWVHPDGEPLSNLVIRLHLLRPPQTKILPESIKSNT